MSQADFFFVATFVQLLLGVVLFLKIFNSLGKRGNWLTDTRLFFLALASGLQITTGGVLFVLVLILRDLR